MDINPSSSSFSSHTRVPIPLAILMAQDGIWLIYKYRRIDGIDGIILQPFAVVQKAFGKIS